MDNANTNGSKAMDTDVLIKQLGAALPMMGARNLVRDEHSLWFSIGANPKRGNKVTITLCEDDTYRVAFYRVPRMQAIANGATPEQIGEIWGVYADGLHAALKSLTGLETRL